MHSVFHLGSLSLLHQTAENKMSSKYCYVKIAVVCFHINSLQSQQSFCFFLVLRAVWVISFMQLCPNQVRHDVCQSTFLSTQTWIKAISELFSWFFCSLIWQFTWRSELVELVQVHDGRQLEVRVSEKGFFFFNFWCFLRQNFIHLAQLNNFKSLLW